MHAALTMCMMVQTTCVRHALSLVRVGGWLLA